jgi:two-component system, OmpR family, sensor kinase
MPRRPEPPLTDAPPRQPWLQRHSIRVRLSWAFMLFRLLVLALGLFAIWRLAEVNAASVEIRDHWLQSVRVLGDLNNYTSDYRAAEADHLLSQSATEMAASEQSLAELARTVAASERGFEALPHDPTETRLWRDFAQDWDNYRRLSDQVVALSAANHKAAGTSLYRTSSASAYNTASDALGLLTERTVSSAQEASNRAESIFRQTRVFIVLAVIVAGLMTVVVMRHITRSISEPILDLGARMRALAANQTDVQVAGGERMDEIGAMARAVAVFRNNAIELAHSQRGLEQQASMLSEKLEQEQRLATLQRNFVSMASHEFRTPLTLIDGQAQRLIKMRDQLSGEELGERAGKIRAAVLRMTHLIDSLLNSSRLIESDEGLYYHPAAIDLAAVLHEVCQTYREINPAARIFESLRAVPPQIPGDAKLLYQAFSNLLSNAIKYSPGGSQVRVEAAQEADMLLVTVQDNGIGVPAQDLPHLFERYHRGHNVKGIVGTGIGLYLVKTVTDLHGGSVAVESTEGKGSRFMVRLPVSG